jgi:hypothetical protein
LAGRLPSCCGRGSGYAGGAAQAGEAFLQYSALQAAHGPFLVPRALKPIPTLNALPSSRGLLRAPFGWGKGPALVFEEPTWKLCPRVIWLEARDSGWAYRVEPGRPWPDKNRVLTSPEFAEKDFLPQKLAMARSVLKANQEEAGAFTADSAGDQLDPKWRGKMAIVMAPKEWTAEHFLAPGTRPETASIVAFLEVRFN